MLKVIHLLEYIEYYGYDEIEKENIEEKYIIGYFTSVEKLQIAKKLCMDYGLDDKLLFSIPFELEVNYNQVYVYILNYEYSKLINGEYIDYYYYFEPKSNIKKCIVLKNNLKKLDKYKHTDYKIYDNTTDGFSISKIKLNFVSHIGYFDI